MNVNNNKTQLERMKELIEIIKAADIAYYRDDNPMMTDREYDLLFDELKSKPDLFYLDLPHRLWLERYWKN